MRHPGLASVALAALLAHGCTMQPVVVEMPPRVEPSPPPRTIPPGTSGQISMHPGRVGLVVAAPHATSDLRTGDIATEVARRTGFGLVVATGFTIGPDTVEAAARRYGVNRPLEGVPGRDAAEERATPAARGVYEAYVQRVREAAGGPLRYYVEIHGNARRDTAERIEIATVGIDGEHALQLRTLLELTRDAHLRGHPGAPRLRVLIEPADSLVYTASAAKREGILRLPERALHIELPRLARDEFRELYTAILGDFLADAVALRAFR